MSNISSFYYSQCPLKGVLRVTGEDAASYLQGQFSNQLEQPGSHPVVYGFWLSIKGKVDADSYVLKQGNNDYLLISFGCDEATLLAKVGNNIIADDVILEGVTKKYQAWVTWGGDSDAIEASYSLTYPDPGQGVAYRDGWVFQGKLLRSKNLVWLLPEEDAVSFEDAGQHVPIEIARVGEAVPFVPKDIGPADLPHEGGLEGVGVSVSKGCYLGQVIMMRIHSMGNIKRGLYCVQLTEDTPPLPADLYLGERPVGALRSAVTIDGVQQGLALLKKNIAEPGVRLSLGPEKDACVEVLAPVKPIL